LHFLHASLDRQVNVKWSGNYAYALGVLINAITSTRCVRANHYNARILSIYTAAQRSSRLLAGWLPAWGSLVLCRIHSSSHASSRNEKKASHSCDHVGTFNFLHLIAVRICPIGSEIFSTQRKIEQLQHGREILMGKNLRNDVLSLIFCKANV
jgi:hypothetical protein